MNKMYAALGANVFVKEIEQQTMVGDWVVPDSISDSDFTFGEVISCAEGYFDKGSFVPSNVTIGDKVMFPKVSGTKITFNGKQYIRVMMYDIVAKEIEAEIQNEGDK